MGRAMAKLAELVVEEMWWYQRQSDGPIGGRLHTWWGQGRLVVEDLVVRTWS